jgi:hypothetical protein
MIPELPEQPYPLTSNDQDFNIVMVTNRLLCLLILTGP